MLTTVFVLKDSDAALPEEREKLAHQIDQLAARRNRIGFVASNSGMLSMMVRAASPTSVGTNVASVMFVCVR